MFQSLLTPLVDIHQRHQIILPVRKLVLFIVNVIHSITVGYLAQVIQAIEANPFTSRLTDHNPTTEYLKCTALHSKSMPSSLREAILDSPSSSKVLKYMDSSLETRALIRTSTAVDVIRGGEKGEYLSRTRLLLSPIGIANPFVANALPETAYAIVNHRIAIEESIQTLKDHYTRIVSPLTSKWNFVLNAFGKEIDSKIVRTGTVTLAGHDELEPSPVSNHKDVRFSWLAGTLRGVFGEEVYVAPVLLTGE